MVETRDLLPDGETKDNQNALFPSDLIRALQIIADLEGTTGGPYGRCVDYFSCNGNLDTCITIRTALLKDGKAYTQASRRQHANAIHPGG